MCNEDHYTVRFYFGPVDKPSAYEVPFLGESTDEVIGKARRWLDTMRDSLEAEVGKSHAMGVCEGELFELHAARMVFL